MKKVLLGTTALAAAALVSGQAAAQGPISLGLDGYYENIFSYTDQDDANGKDFNGPAVRHEGEIHFKGRATLDIGLTVGFEAQLEAITQGDQMDETYLYFEGGWGRVNIGAENSAAYLMNYSAPSAGLGVNSPNFFIFSPQGLEGTSGFLNATSDANKVTYFTPRFGGFQFGASYTPDLTLSERGGVRNTFGLDTDTAGDFKNAINLGANFVESFAGVDVAIAGGFEWAECELCSDGSTDDLHGYSTGANFGYAGFTLGGSWMRTNGYNASAGVFADNVQNTFWDVGLAYANGPWGVSFAYARSKGSGTGLSSGDVFIPAGGDSDASSLFELGGSYALGPGVKIYGAAQYYTEDLDSWRIDDSEGVVSNDEADGWALAIGTRLDF